MMPLRRFPSSSTYVPTALSFMMTRTKIRPADVDSLHFASPHLAGKKVEISQPRATKSRLHDTTTSTSP